MQSTIARDRRFDPFRTPHWRWELAGTCDRPAPPRRWRDDGAVVAAWRYQQRARVSEERADDREPAVAWARALWLEERPGARELEARVLAGQSTEAIASLMGIDPSLIRVYEALFFDVRASEAASAWLTEHVLHQDETRPPSRRDQWRWIGRYLGVWVIDLLVSAERRQWALPLEELATLRKIDRMIPFFMAPFADRQPLFRYVVEYADVLRAHLAGDLRAQARELEASLERYHRGVAEWSVLERASGMPAEVEAAVAGAEGLERRAVVAKLRRLTESTSLPQGRVAPGVTRVAASLGNGAEAGAPALGGDEAEAGGVISIRGRVPDRTVPAILVAAREEAGPVVAAHGAVRGVAATADPGAQRPPHDGAADDHAGPAKGRRRGPRGRVGRRALQRGRVSWPQRPHAATRQPSPASAPV